MMKHGDGSIMLCSYFLTVEIGRLVIIERRINAAMKREVLKENLLQSAHKLGPG